MLNKLASKYERGKVLGSGTWGVVFEAIRLSDNLRVAVKKIDSQGEGLNYSAIREIKHLQELDGGVYILKLHEVFMSGGSIHLVLDFCSHDLEKIIRNKTVHLRTEHIKCYIKQILLGMAHCHSYFILHRDMKPANILVTDSGIVKIADFGLARNFSSPIRMTNDVNTMFYKPPELLFGARFYSPSIDVWAVGCILAELILRRPLFPGSSPIEQLSLIFNVLGTPLPVPLPVLARGEQGGEEQRHWPDACLLPDYMEFEERSPLNLSSIIKSHGIELELSQLNAAADKDYVSSELKILSSMLSLDPRKRPSCKELLESHPYLNILPLPCEHTELKLPTVLALNT